MLKTVIKDLLPSSLHPPLRAFVRWVRFVAASTRWHLRSGGEGLAFALRDNWERLAPQRLDRVRFPAHAAPRVSIVIPVHDQYRFTARCLASIAAAGAESTFEVIVVDDRSTDETRRRLRAVEGLQVVESGGERGFVHACNRGLATARGEFVLFLNNDTTVESGWLDHLVATFRTFPRAGAVGAQLRFADGRLQEAGGIVWRDGSAWNYGRYQRPDDPRFNFARQVDYCSAACLMVRRELLLELNGFDTLFAPGYYEDTDLAFRIRAAGLEVYYQPLARVRHYEGATAGRSLSAGMKRHQVENRERFFERWKEVLAGHRPNGVLPEIEKERRVDKRVLVIEPRMIRRDRDSGSLRMFHWLTILRDLGYRPTFAPENMCRVEPYASDLQGRGVEVLYAPFVRRLTAHLSSCGSLYDVVIVSRLAAGRLFLPVVRRLCPQALVVFDTVDLHFVREDREAEIEKDSAKRRLAARTRQDELAAARSADVVVVVSEVERRLLLAEAPDVNVQVVSNIHRLYPQGGAFEDRRDLLFVGGFEHPPNIDAARWLVESVLPRLGDRLPGVRLHLVGSDPPAEVRALQGARADVVGHVPNLSPYLEGCRLSVAPLRYGAGVKGKINQSMAHGLPVVATSIACEGMWLEDGRDVLVADEAAGFADAICRLYNERELWDRLAAGGRRNIEQHYSFAAAEKATRTLLAQPRRGREVAG